MPRVESAESTSDRMTRASSAAAADSSASSRRALGDVSNRGASRSKAAKKPAFVEQPPRRSRRLSKDPTEDSNQADGNNNTTRRKSLRTSSKSKPAKSQQPSAASRKRGTISSLSKSKDEASSGHESKPAALSKRLRVLEADETEPRKKAARNYSGERSACSDGEESSLDGLMTDRVNPCSDILESTDYGLQRVDFDSSQYTPGIAAYDKDYENDALEVSNYVTDIFQRLYDAEAKTRPQPYMDSQIELNSMMRAILVDWIVEVHMKFRLLPETLYLCVNIIDRYLSTVRVQRKRLQLVGVTALLVACKYEEIYPPEVKDCVYITDRAYSRQDVLDMEAHIVKTLRFHLTVPTGYPFLQRFLHIIKASKVTRNLATFYLERMLQEYGSLIHKPSLMAATAISLALNNPDLLDYEGFDSDIPPGLPPKLMKYTGFGLCDILEVALLMEEKVGETNTTFSRRSLVAVKRKYEAERYGCVSTSFTLPRVHHLGEL